MMSDKYKFYNPDGIYFVTLTVVKWVEVFTRDIYREIIIDSLKYCQKHKGLRIYAYVIMTNHLHLIISKKGNIPLQNIMRDFKKFTSNEIIKAIMGNQGELQKEKMLSVFRSEGRKNPNNKFYQLWQHGNHPIELTNNTMMDQRLDYLHYNPVKHGLVTKAEDYRWSSLSNYMGKGGLIEIDFIE